MLVDKFSPMVYRVAMRFFGPGPEAQDASQEAFLRVHRSFHTFDPTRPLKPWMARITYNVCLKRLGKAGRALTDTTDPHDIGLMGDQAATDPERQAAADEAGSLLLEALGGLAAQDRVLLELHYREGMALAEVSEATGMPVNTIKTRMHRARAALKLALAPVLKESVA